MSKRTIINLILLSIIVTIGFYLKNNPVEKIKPNILTTLRSDQVDTIVIQRQDKEELIFEKTDSQWMITAPFSNNANLEKISLLLRFLNLKSRHQYKSTEQKQLTRYELDNIKVSLFLNDQQFDFGNTNDFNHLRYVLHKGIVHSVKDITHHLLVADAESFIIEK
jgi:hypothetical protein